jgi:hypothetical protein
MGPFVEWFLGGLKLVHRGSQSRYTEWEFSLPFDFADWLYDHTVVSVRKYVDPISEIPSTLFMTDEFVIVQNGKGKVIFLGEDHQRYILDGFRIDDHADELIWDFESDSASCVRLADDIRKRVEAIRMEFQNV